LERSNLTSMKICTNCKKEKSIDEFAKRKDSKDGLNYWCNSCRKEKRSIWEKDKEKREFRKIEKFEREKNYDLGLKKCIKCKEIQRLSEFPFREDSKDGLRSNCNKCTQHSNIIKYSENKEEIKANSKAYYNENKERLLIKQKILNTKHKQEKPNYHKEYYDLNRKEILSKKSIYIQKNLPKIIAKNVKRYATKKQRTPKWLSEDQIKQMQDIYIECDRKTKETGIKHHVDHIEPLQGEDISGLHVPWNLQIITAAQNMTKGNRRK